LRIAYSVAAETAPKTKLGIILPVTPQVSYQVLPLITAEIAPYTATSIPLQVNVQTAIRTVPGTVHKAIPGASFSVDFAA